MLIGKGFPLQIEEVSAIFRILSLTNQKKLPAILMVQARLWGQEALIFLSPAPSGSLEHTEHTENIVVFGLNRFRGRIRPTISP